MEHIDIAKCSNIFRVANIAAKIWLINLGTNFGYLKVFFSLAFNIFVFDNMIIDNKLHDVC